MAAYSNEVHSFLVYIQKERELASLVLKRTRKLFRTKLFTSEKTNKTVTNLTGKKLNHVPFPEPLPSRKMRLLRLV